MILDQIVEKKKHDLSSIKKAVPVQQLERKLNAAKKNPFWLRTSIQNNQKALFLICEMKKASPSNGLLKRVYSPHKIAQEFAAGGANAMSILTEQRYFLGDVEHLKDVRKITTLPILRKDFVIDEYQIVESRVAGADAILLIVSLLSDKELNYFIRKATTLELDVLVETHTAGEVARAARSGATLIGINNRNLNTLQTDVRHAESMIKEVPQGTICVVESGIETRDDIRRYLDMGVSTFLIGTVLMKASRIAEVIDRLRGLS